MVAWSTLVEGSSRIVLSEFVDDAWTAPRPVTPAAWDQYDPALAVDPDGLLVLSYWATDGVSRVVASIDFHLVSRDLRDPVSELLQLGGECGLAATRVQSKTRSRQRPPSSAARRHASSRAGGVHTTRAGDRPPSRRR